MHKIIHSDCLEAMRNMEDNSIDFCVCDPPYGINFMSKQFDRFKDQPAFNSIYWKEVLRICKPGSMLAAFGGDRTHHHLMNAIEDAGWEIRTCIYWIFGSGFPKSHNKFGFDGYGTALKPAAEIIVLAMKPLDGTFAHNAEKWGVAGINIESSRIETNERPLINSDRHDGNNTYGKGLSGSFSNGNTSLGRWPANLILDEESAEQLDQMTGVLKSGAGDKHNKTQLGGYHGNFGLMSGKEYKADSGGASRFFYCAKASSSERNRGLEGMPEYISSKTGAEKRLTVGGSKDISLPKQNTHPTVKPISLMKYIVTLLVPPGNPTCLDPFMGSGSTGVACKELGIDFIGIEKEAEYVEIATKRIEFAKSPDLELFTA